MAKTDKKALAAVLADIIKSNEPMLADFHIRVIDKQVLRSRVSVTLKTITIPGGWSIEQILLEIGPTMRKAAMQIEYDAHEINDNIDIAIKDIIQRSSYLARFAPHLTYEILDAAAVKITEQEIN